MLKTTSDTTEASARPYLEIVIFAGAATVFGALVGWLILSYFVRSIAEILQWNYLANNANWITPILFGLLNGMNSLTKSLARIKRREQRRALGNEIGLEHSDHLDTKLNDAIQALYGGSVFNLSNILHRDFGDSHLVIADMTVATNERPGKGSTNERTFTIIYLSDPNISMPRFQMMPTNALTRWLTGLAGFNSLDVSRRPEFAARYQIHTPTPGSVSRFFDDALLDNLAQQANWHIHGHDSCVLLWQADHSRSSSTEQVYMDEALAVFQLLRARAVEWQLLNNDRESEQTTSEAQTTGLGLLTDCQIIRPADVKQLLEQPVPRRSLPKNIRAQKFGFPIVPLVGLMFTIGGSIFFTAAWFEELRIKNGKEWLLGWMGGSMLVAGLIIFLGACYYRWAWGRLLIHGHVALAKVAQVERTEVLINDRRRYLVTLEYQANGQAIITQLPVYGHNHKIAEDVKDNDRHLHVLFNPTQPKHATVAEDLIS